jgi:hypothetical protein
MGYVILQDSIKNKGMNLVLVDRTKTKEKWWTSVLENALVFTSKLEASKQCDKLKFNNPRVVPFDSAKNEVEPIITTTYKRVKRRKNIFQMDMWEYKEWLGYSDVIEQGGESGSF